MHYLVESLGDTWVQKTLYLPVFTAVSQHLVQVDAPLCPSDRPPPMVYQAELNAIGLAP